MKKLLAMLLSLFLSTCCVSFAAEDELHLYLDIPFAKFSTQELAQFLLEQKQVILEHPFSTADASGLRDFGYSFRFSAYYGDSDVIDRIVLTSEDAYAENTEHFQQLVKQHILQFVDLDRQLTQLYGEPDIRFFWAGDGKYQMTISEGFAPSNGTWSAAQLLKVFENDQLLRARSVWNNVILELWPNGIKEHPRGYLSKLMLSFENEVITGPVKTLREYP